MGRALIAVLAAALLTCACGGELNQSEFKSSSEIGFPDTFPPQFQIADDIPFDNIRVKIENFRVLPWVGNEFLRTDAPENGAFVTVEFSFENMTYAEIDGDEGPIVVLVDPWGHEYSPDLEATEVLRRTDDRVTYGISNLAPKVTYFDTIAFQANPELMKENGGWFFRVGVQGYYSDVRFILLPKGSKPRKELSTDYLRPVSSSTHSSADASRLAVALYLAANYPVGFEMHIGEQTPTNPGYICPPTIPTEPILFELEGEDYGTAHVPGGPIKEVIGACVPPIFDDITDIVLVYADQISIDNGNAEAEWISLSAALQSQFFSAAEE